MSICTYESMTNHHAPGFWSALSDTFHLWRERYRSRRELAQLTERDLRDFGVSSTEVAFELKKPFWRA
jgi:uncharacterized protein YjiS (DUF1127 family)